MGKERPEENKDSVSRIVMCRGLCKDFIKEGRDTITGLQICPENGHPWIITMNIRLHPIEVRSDERGKIDLVDYAYSAVPEHHRVLVHNIVAFR